MTPHSSARDKTRLRITGPGSRPFSICMLAALVAALLLAVPEAGFANKFETIGGGVSGSTAIKREWLQVMFFVAAGFCALGAVLVVVMPHNNPLFLNYRNWKTSSFLMGLFALVLGAAGLII